jgi:hypothetical protein
MVSMTTTNATTVIGFELGFANSALRVPYILARLSCGHLAGVALRPRRGACATCGAERGLDDAPPGGWTCCGRSSFRVTFTPDPHAPADRVTAVGDAVACDACAREAAAVGWLRGLDRATVLHSRFRYGSYHFYRRAPESPSGVLLIGSVPACPAIERVLAELRYAPLSPTEGF